MNVYVSIWLNKIKKREREEEETGHCCLQENQLQHTKACRQLAARG